MSSFPTTGGHGGASGQWREEVEALGSALVELDADPTFALLVAATLTGDTAAAWSTVRAALVAAWSTYRVAREVADDFAASTSGPGVATTAAVTVPSPTGPVAVEVAVRSAADAVATACAFVDSIRVAWDDWTRRAGAARDQVMAAGPGAPAVASADALLDLLLHDPFAVHEADLVGIEATAGALVDRSAAHQRAVVRLRLDIDQAEALCEALRDLHPRARGAIIRATERIGGFARNIGPVEDINQLGRWLTRITSAAVHDPDGAARALGDWRSAAQTRVEELDDAERAALAAVAHRDALRGRWQAYKSKGGALALDEQQVISAALDELRDRLWTAPCDLAAAERELVGLARLLDRGLPRAGEE